MGYETLILTREGKVATITLNRPTQLNAINREMAYELMAACDELDGDESVNAVIVAGAGRAFCAGGDLKDAEQLRTTSKSNAEVWAGIKVWDDLALKVKSLELPTIAAIHGYALGGGFCLAMACDLRVVAEDAQLAVIFTKSRTFQGRPMEGGSAADMALTWNLPRLVGAGRAAELLFTGDYISADKAERIGLVNRVVPPAKVMAAARELATQIAGCSRQGLKVTKRALHLSIYDRLASHLVFEAAAQTHMMLAGRERDRA